MAPPNFPNGLDLHSIGYVTLKYPDLAPALPVPSARFSANQNQYNPIKSLSLPGSILILSSHSKLAMRRLSMTNPHPNSKSIGQLPYSTVRGNPSSKRSPTTLCSLISNSPAITDLACPKSYFSNAVLLMNWLSSSPDVCKRIAAHPTLVNNLVEKLLAPDFHDGMRQVVRPALGSFPPASFEEDFGSVLQFLSTLLLYQAEMESLHPRIKELIPRLREWGKKYRNSHVTTIGDVCECMAMQINGMIPGMIAMMRNLQEELLVCGVTSCRVHNASQLTACGSCRIQRYCGRDHQKADWKYHKHICKKGFVEPGP